jgi:hypothetical protein
MFWKKLFYMNYIEENRRWQSWDTYFQLRYIQTSSLNAVNKKLFLASLLFNFHKSKVYFISLKHAFTETSFSSAEMRQAEDR